MGIPAKKYDQLARCFAEQGVHAVINELRGTGSSSVRASKDCDYGYADLVEVDLAAAVDECARQFPNSPLYLFGHSLGGQLSSLYVGQLTNRRRKQIAGIILSASCSVYFRGWSFPGNLSILIFSQLSALIARVKGYFPGHSLGFGGREAKTVMQDWAHNARTGRYRLRGSSTNYQAALSKVDQAILALNFEHDRFAPLNATKQLVSMMASRDLTYQDVTAAELGLNKADHFTWMRSPQFVADQSIRWIRTHFPAQ